VVCNPQEGLLSVSKFGRTKAGVPVPAHQKFWVDKRASLKTAFKDWSATHPDIVPVMHQLFQVLCDIEGITGLTPASVGESKEWAAILNLAEENHENYFQALRGKPQFSALYGTYTLTLHSKDESKGYQGHRNNHSG
jgi:hypothetical protein